VGERGRWRGPTTAAGRALATLLALALVVVTALAACGGDDDDHAGSRGDAASAATKDKAKTKAEATPSVADDPQAILDARPYPVGRRDETLVDDSRPTQAVPAQHIAAQPDRTIGLIVLYPAASGPAPAGVADETVADARVADGRFPLLVFAHGWTGTGESLVPTAQHWASAGYVVALPTFPLSKEGIGFSDDLPQQPGDVRFVLDTVLGYGADRSDPLGGHVDADHVAVGGHSLGSATAWGFLNSCCRDPRVDAIVSVSGGPLAYPHGSYADQLALPLLLVHGARDKTVDHGASEIVFRRFTGDIGYLLITGGDHTSFFRGDDYDLFDRTMVAFLDAKLGLDPHALDGYADEVAATGRATFRTKG
jgi:predicted dienelactone hydrolase